MPSKTKRQSKESTTENIGYNAREYDLKFGSLEVVIAVGDLDTEDRNEKFLIGRLEEDVFLGTDKEAEVAIEWFDFVKDKTFQSDGIVDLLPVGSLVCSITNFCEEGFSKGKVLLEISDEAFQYAERKLAEQLNDEYNSDDDSQFGDEAIRERFRSIGKKSSVVVVEKEEDDEVAPKRKKSKVIREEDFDGEDMNGDQEGGSGRRKRKSTSGMTGSKKKKKATKGLTPRPNFKQVEDSFLKKGKIQTFDGDIERSTKEVHRAIKSQDPKALKASVKSNTVHSLYYPQSIGLPLTPFMIAVMDKNMDAVKVLLDDMKSSGEKGRPSLQRCALPQLNTGKQTSRFANYNRRQVGASRGGREGNNALIHDGFGERFKTPDLDQYGNCSCGTTELPLKFVSYQEDGYTWDFLRDFDEISTEILDLTEATYSRSPSHFYAIENMMRGGHRLMAKRIIEQCTKGTFNPDSYNFLHLESLGDAPKDPKKPFSKDFQVRSVSKKSDTETRFSPLACACINPEVAYLEALLTAAPEHATLVDSKATTLLHYAAACEGSGPLKYLLERHSLPRAAVDKRKETPLHYAARAARPENVKVLLNGVEADQMKTILNAKSTEGYAAIHYAAQTRRANGIDTVKALLNAGVDANMMSTASRSKVSPMHIAARVGDLALLKLLVEFGGKPNKGDKLGRTPLILATTSGHIHVVSYLIRLGVDIEAADTSENKAVHYAAAYGWDDCLQLLLDAGADPDAKNSWKTSPLSVAIQKGRHCVSSKLLRLPQVDVNFKDDDGKTLFVCLMEGYIARTVLAHPNQLPPFVVTEKEEASETESKTNDSHDKELETIRSEMPWALQKLLDRDDVELMTKDADDNNVLHRLWFQDYPADGDGEARAIAISRLIMTYGEHIDVNTPSADGRTPLFHATASGNRLLFEFLLSQGATLSPDTVDKQGRNICHHLVGKQLLACKDQLILVEKSLGKETFMKMLESLDNDGMSPLHYAMLALIEKEKESFTAANELLKSLVTRFPHLASIVVGRKKLFSDAPSLASAIVTANEQQSSTYRARYRDESPQILSGGDELNPQKIRDALKSRNKVVPVGTDHLGKALVHFACRTKNPFQLKEVLEWLVPMSMGVVADEGGRGKESLTPCQQLVYRVMTSHLVSSTDRGGTREDKLNVLLDSVKVLITASKGDINSVPKGYFREATNFPSYADGGSQEHSSEDDDLLVATVISLADGVASDPETGKGDDFLQAFQTLMEARERRFLANQQGTETVHLPLCCVLAKSGSKLIPIPIWERLVREFQLDLALVDRVKGENAIHICLRGKDQELAQFLCSSCPELLQRPSKSGERAIHVVAKVDDPTFVKLVLAHLPDKSTEVNKGDASGRTAFHFSVEKAATRSSEVLEPCESLFMRAGARVDIPDHCNNRTPLHYCFLENASQDHFNFPHSSAKIRHDRVELISSLLAADGAKEGVNMSDRFGRTPLTYAAAYDSTVSSLLLISKGADLFHVDSDGNTPVNIAVLRGHDNYSITLLKSAGENLPKLVDIVDIRRRKQQEGNEFVIKEMRRDAHSIVWHAIKSNFRGLVYILLDASFPLYRAAVDALDNGSFQLVRKLITTSSLDVVQYIDPNSGNTLLHEVACVRRYQNVEWSTALGEQLLLLDVKASTLSRDGQTALHMAVSHEHIDLAKLLVNADPAASLIRDKYGQTALHMAASRGYVGFARVCVSVDPTVVQVQDGEGKTALHIAASRGYVDLTKVVVDADPSAVLIQDEGGRTALHVAASQGYVDIARVLVNADPSVALIRGGDGRLPLSRFMRGLPNLHLSETRCVEMLDLLTSGMDSLNDEALNKVPRTTKEAKTWEYKDITFRPGPNRQTVLAELEKKKTKMVIDDEEDMMMNGFSTLIIQALYARKLILVQELIDKGALLDLHDSEGLAPIHHAVMTEFLWGLIALLRNGADPNIRGNGAHKLTPLLMSCLPSKGGQASVKLVQCLLRFNADVLLPDALTGKTALHLSCVHNNHELAEILLRAADHERQKTMKAKIPEEGKFLVRFGPDCGLYPAVVEGNKVKVWDPQGSILPCSLLSEVHECSDLALDSWSALLQLKTGTEGEKGENLPITDMGDKTRSIDGDDDDDDDDYIDEGKDEEETDDGDDDDEEEEADITQQPNKHHRGGSQTSQLHDFYGLEELVVGCSDTNLTSRLKKDSSVLIQDPRRERYYANSNNLWLEGTVLAAYKNGTYDVGLSRGPVVKGVMRQLIRPWKHGQNRRKGKSSSRTLEALLSKADKNGMTPIQTVIKPLEFGSYENMKLLELLVHHGAALDSKAIGLARKNSTFLKCLRQKLGMKVVDETPTGPEALLEDMTGLEPLSHETLDLDTKAALVDAEAKGVLKRADTTPKVNKVCELKGVGIQVLPVSTDVVTNTKNSDSIMFFDVIMTKVELSQWHSENAYYKMQIVEDPNKGLFVLLTNWGYVGDYGGQKQETPFGSRDDAIKEFCKVFKSKSGNQWEDYQVGKFESIVGKYKPVKLLPSGYEKPVLPDLVEMIQEEEEYPEVIRKSALSQPLTEAFEAFVDPSMIRRRADECGLQQDQLPLGMLSIATILEAERKLEEVKVELDLLGTLNKPEQLQEKRLACDKVAVLSSQYFQLLPTKEGHKALEPLTQDSLKEQRKHIAGLKDVTVASQFVNAASFKANEIHPLDYVYRATNASLKPLKMQDPERIGIEQYFRNTTSNRGLVINEVFRLKRFDEKDNGQMKNHRLLWHGTHVANMLGVIKEGLRVAPSTAQISGNAFGEGIYFSDMASKSWYYCRASFDSDAEKMPRAYLFVADVALGESCRVTDPDWGTREIDSTYDSVFAVGHEGPDSTKDITSSSTGDVIPLGPVIRNPSFKRTTWRKGSTEMKADFVRAIERVRNDPNTTFPAKVQAMYEDRAVEVIIEHGPLATVARVVPMKKRKKNDGGSKTTNKRRKGSGGEKFEEGKEKEEEPDELESFPEFEIKRMERDSRNQIHYNEYIVKDPQRVNLRYIVELTSKAWLKNQADKKKKLK